MECHTYKHACHAQCTMTMPTNVRDDQVIWRCEECVAKKGDTGCSFARWVEGLSWAKVQGDADKWRVDHQYVGKQVIKQFGNKLYAGQIQKWMPGSKQEWEVWHIKQV